jgi:hypothetical protein
VRYRFWGDSDHYFGGIILLVAIYRVLAIVTIAYFFYLYHDRSVWPQGKKVNLKKVLLLLLLGVVLIFSAWFVGTLVNK